MTIAEQITNMERGKENPKQIKQLAAGARILRAGITISRVQFSDNSTGAIRNTRLS